MFQLPGRAVRSSDENKGRIGARGGVRARRDEDEDEDEEADDEDAPEVGENSARERSGIRRRRACTSWSGIVERARRVRN